MTADPATLPVAIPTPKPAAPPPARPVVPAPTEAEVLALLRAKHARPGNGGSGEFAFLPHVRDAAAFDAKRTIDAVVVSLWPSRGLTIDGFEVKVSRGDWLRELAKPAKAEDTCRLVDRFWIVAPAGVVHDGELPPTWGLLEVVGGKPDPDQPAVVVGRKLKQVKAAPLLHEEKTRTKPVSRDLLVGLLRAAEGAVENRRTEQQAGRADENASAAYSRGYVEGGEHAASQMKALREQRDKAQAALLEFQRVTGVSLANGGLGSWNWSTVKAEQVGKALRAVLNSDPIVAKAQERLDSVADGLTALAEQVRAAGRFVR